MAAAAGKDEAIAELAHVGRWVRPGTAEQAGISGEGGC